MDALQGALQPCDISGPSFFLIHGRPSRAQHTLCFSSRRHQRRRRHRGMDSTSTQRSFFPSKLEEEDYDDDDDDDGFYENVLRINRPPSDSENLVITLDLKAIRNRAEALRQGSMEALHSSTVRVVNLGHKVIDLGHNFVNESKNFVGDIRSSVSMNRDRRIVISIRKSSLDFARNVILWSAIVIVVWKLWAKFSKKYRWGWEAEDGFGSREIFKRDRSLGGREVFVGNWFFNRKPKTKQNFDIGSPKSKVWKPKTEIGLLDPESGNNRRRINPLDALDVSRSEKVMVKPRSKSMKPSEKSLPGWWPPSIRSQTSSLPSNGSRNGDEVSLMKVIIEKRLSGKDFEKADIFELRRICRNSGVRVSFDTMYLRDSFYRATINMVLSSCGRSRDSQVEIMDEKPAEFLAGLAENISLEAERAAVMVNAAVAARTRSTFLQAWALYVQGKVSEAEEEIAQLSCIHTIFPPDVNSPEMEMVGQGLARHLAFDERKQLLAMYVKAGGNSVQRVASEALGLSSTRNML